MNLGFDTKPIYKMWKWKRSNKIKFIDVNKLFVVNDDVHVLCLRRCTSVNVFIKIKVIVCN